jgi:hypothetical protein
MVVRAGALEAETRQPGFGRGVVVFGCRREAPNAEPARVFHHAKAGLVQRELEAGRAAFARRQDEKRRDGVVRLKRQAADRDQLAVALGRDRAHAIRQWLVDQGVEVGTSGRADEDVTVPAGS